MMFVQNLGYLLQRPLSIASRAFAWSLPKNRCAGLQQGGLSQRCHTWLVAGPSGGPRVLACFLEVPGRERFSVKDCARWYGHETIRTRIGGFREESRGEGQAEGQEVGQDRQQ